MSIFSTRPAKRTSNQLEGKYLQCFTLDFKKRLKKIYNSLNTAILEVKYIQTRIKDLELISNSVVLLLKTLKRYERSSYSC